MEEYERKTKEIPGSRAIEDSHELEEKIGKYTKMLHKNRAKMLDAELYQGLCRRALIKTLKGGAANIEGESITASSEAEQRMHMVDLQCKGLIMIENRDSFNIDKKEMLEIV